MLQEKFVCTAHESSYFLQQFLIILDCCPNTDSPAVPFLKLKEDDSPMLYAKKYTPLWNEMHVLAENNLKLLEKLQSQFFSNTVPTFKNSKIYDHLLTRQQCNIIFKKCDEFENILSSLKKIKNAFCYQEKQQHNSLLGGIDELQQRIEDLLNTKKMFQVEEIISDDDADICENKIENLRKKILLGVQKVYKKYIADKENFEEQHESDTNPVKENHLKNELMKSLHDEIDILDIDNVCKRIYGLIKKILQGSVKNKLSRKR